MSPRQETIDENIVPLRLSKKRSSKKTREKFRFDPRRHAALFGYAVLGLLSFLIFFVSSLPLERLSNQILQILSDETQMDWNAESVHISVLFGPKISFEKLTISQRAGAPATDLFSRIVGDGIAIDSLSFRPSLLKLLPIYGVKESQPAGSFSAELYGADLDGSFVYSPALLELGLNLDNLDRKKVPQITNLVALQGEVKELNLALSAPRGRIASATGEVSVVADKLRFDPASLSQADMIKNMGLLNFGKLEARAKLRPGTLSLNEFSVSGKDSDLEVKIEGDLAPNDDIVRSSMSIVLWLTPSQKLQTLFPLVANFLQMEKKANNAYVTRINGTFLEPRFTKY